MVYCYQTASGLICTGDAAEPSVNVIVFYAVFRMHCKKNTELHEDIQAAMKGMLDPEFREKVTGHATIRQTFKVSGGGTSGVAYVTAGKFMRNSGQHI